MASSILNFSRITYIHRLDYPCIMDYKTIQDTIHGSVKFQGLFLELLECPELQRLHNIIQLGLTKLVFPGANHTRLEHSIGTYGVAHKMSVSLGLKDDEKDLVMAAALLHDIGHPPFSHTLESILENLTGMDHMDITKEFITGNRYIEDRDVPLIPEILENHDISPERVAELVKGKSDTPTISDFSVHRDQKYFGEEKYLYQMIHGPLDVDQLDYLLRDSHYTGALHGVIDIERLLQTMEIHNGDLVVSKGGIPAVEGMLVARGLMYSSVYFHKTARIAELMLAKAVHSVKDGLEDIFLMTDFELLSKLREDGGFPAEMVQRLTYRRLYKRCYSLEKEDTDKLGMNIDEYGTTDGIRRLEKKIAFEAKLSDDLILVDIPHRELKLSEPRLTKTGVKVLDGNRLYDLTKYSPLAFALQKRTTPLWGIMVSCPHEVIEVVSKASEKTISR